MDRQQKQELDRWITREQQLDPLCVICEEPVGEDAGAEMHHPDNPEEFGGYCHAECGLQKGWIQS